MADLSLREAAMLCGRGKSTIQAAIKSGTMSAKKNERGGYEIDPAELNRVFPLIATDARTLDTGQNAQNDSNRTPPDTDPSRPDGRPVASEATASGQDRTGQALSEAQQRIAHLEELLKAEREGRIDLKEALQARVDDLQESVADLRKRLDTAEAEKLRLLPAPDTGQDKAPTERRGLWARLTGG